MSASEVVLDVPLEFTADGRVRATLVGDDATIGAAVATIPDPLAVTLESNGEYRASIGDVLSTSFEHSTSRAAASEYCSTFCMSPSMSKVPLIRPSIAPISPCVMRTQSR
ncbi:hypothetical protein [Halomarina halobia]|uniref:hypothetical protein n=1 Tax=Halomarina halobia TaxID=3033386 RepID=UPI003F5D9D41